MATAGRKTRTTPAYSKTPCRIATVMRVKNEGQYLDAAIRSLVPLGGHIVVLDDGSTDSTPDILARYKRELGGRFHMHGQPGREMDEGRDRTYLYRYALSLEPDWIMTMDGDEELDPGSVKRLLNTIKRVPRDVNVLRTFLAVMSGKDRYHVKHVWEQDRVFRVADAKRNHEFSSPHAHNLHCGCVPEMKQRNRVRVNVWFKYWGYETEEAREKKLAFYKEHDPDHYERNNRFVRDRAVSPTRKWVDGPDGREFGIQGITEY